MPRGLCTLVAVIQPIVAVHLIGKAFLQPPHRLTHILGGEVEFGAVTSRDYHALRRARCLEQLQRGLAEFGIAHGEALAHLDGRRFVVQSQAGEFHQTKAKTPSERTNSATAPNANRRPVIPRTRFSAIIVA